MKWKFAAGILIFALDMHAPPPADACGVKLTVKSQTPRKAVARTANPSDVLLLGDPPRRLERDLSAAGHRVEVAPNAAAAKKKQYAVVIVDASMQDEARSNFAGSTVVVRSNDVGADMRNVEKQVARKPLRTDEGRTVVAARPVRQPIAAGPAPDPNRRPVAAKEPTDTALAPTPPPPEPKPAPPPERVVTTTTPKPAPPEVKPAPEPKPVAKAIPAPATKPSNDEVFFNWSSYKLSSTATATLAKHIRWMNEKSDLHVVIEGHADPTGNPDDNMRLAQRRAELVRDYLVNNGIDASRIEVISYGDTRLKYGRADGRNRRVAIVVK
jgi:outer membrane protein OmpA-like peptidoglycan-associated protein